MFDGMPHPALEIVTQGVKYSYNLGNKDATEAGTRGQDPKKTWSQVLNSSPPVSNEVMFDYYPLPSDTTIVSPPDETLLEGTEKFKNCIIGTFTREELCPFTLLMLLLQKFGRK